MYSYKYLFVIGGEGTQIKHKAKITVYLRNDSSQFSGR